jgi:hypothetical protein
MKLSWYDVRPVSNWDKVSATEWIWCLQYVEHLEKLGVKSYFNDPSGDVCFFFRVINDRLIDIAHGLKKKGKKIVYLLDVNYLEREGDSHWLSRITDEHVRTSNIFCGLSDLVLCPSPYLVDVVWRYGHSSAYWPQGIDNRHFKAKKEINLSEPVLMWCGYSMKTELVDEVTNILGARLFVISDKRPELFMPFKFKRWKYRKVPSYLLEGDIGIAPRALDNSYNKGHSSFKILLYLAAGLPVLAAPLSSYSSIIVNGENGFLCQGRQEYKRCSELLTTEMGKAAKETALKYDSSIMARYLIEILKARL